VEGDYTARIHVEEGMWLNIDFQNSAVLSFSIALYPVCAITVCYVMTASPNGNTSWSKLKLKIKYGIFYVSVNLL